MCNCKKCVLLQKVYVSISSAKKSFLCHHFSIGVCIILPRSESQRRPFVIDGNPRNNRTGKEYCEYFSVQARFSTLATRSFERTNEARSLFLRISGLWNRLSAWWILVDFRSTNQPFYKFNTWRWSEDLPDFTHFLSDFSRLLRCNFSTVEILIFETDDLNCITTLVTRFGSLKILGS